MMIETLHQGVVQRRRLHGPLTLGSSPSSDLRLPNTLDHKTGIWALLEPDQLGTGVRILDLGCPFPIPGYEKKLQPGDSYSFGDSKVRLVSESEQEFRFVPPPWDPQKPWTPAVAEFRHGKLWAVDYLRAPEKLKRLGMALVKERGQWLLGDKIISGQVQLNDGPTTLIVFPANTIQSGLSQSATSFWMCGVGLAVGLLGLLNLPVSYHPPSVDSAIENQLRQQDLARMSPPRPVPPKETASLPRTPTTTQSSAVKSAIAAAVAAAMLGGKNAQASIPKGAGGGSAQGIGGLSVNRQAAQIGIGSGQQKGAGGGSSDGILAGIGKGGNGSGARARVLGGGGDVAVEGGLDKEIIAQVINNNINQVRFCYEQGLLRSKSLAGRVMMSFTIASNGGVQVAGVKNSSLNAPIVEECLRQKVMGWQFPAPKLGRLVQVSYPFVFKSME